MSFTCPSLVLHLSFTCPVLVTTRFQFQHLPLFWWIYHHISVFKGIVLAKQQVTEETYQEQRLIVDAFIQVAVVCSYQRIKKSARIIFGKTTT